MTRSTGTGPEVSRDITATGVLSIDSVFRVTGVYKRVNREGRLIQIMDLFRFDQMISARSYVLATESPPQIDQLVSAKGIVRNDEFGPYLRLHSMSEIDAAESGLCSFEFPYPEWCVDEELIRRARALWSLMDEPFQRLVNNLFPSPRHLRGFMQAPGSTRGHHAHAAGLFIHSIETAEIGLDLLARFAAADRSVTLAACMVHDIGKILEYRWEGNKGWRLSDYGRLVGHKFATIQLVTLALAKSPGISPARRNALLHALTAAPAPSWVGIRNPLSPEAMIVSKADRVSAEASLFDSLRIPGSPWGRAHHHLKGRAFLAGAVD